MNAVTALFFAAEETTEAVQIDPIVTEFSNMKVPVLSMVMMGLGSVILLAAIVAGVYFLFDRTDNWGMGLLAGLASYMIFCFLIFSGLQIGLNALPFTKDFVQNKPQQFTAMMTIFSGILSCLSVFLALKYVESQMAKRGQMMTIGVPLAIGIGMFLGSVLSNRQIMSGFQYIMVSSSVNKMGFDAAVTATVQSMVESGYELEEAKKTAIDSLYSMMSEPSASFFLNSFYFVVMGVLETSLAVLLFGEMTDRTEKKWTFIGYGGLMLATVPSLLNSLTSFPSWAGVLVTLAIAAAVGFFTVRQAGQDMPEELNTLSYSHRKNKGGGKGDGHKKKMPHIVMPDK